MLQLVDEVLGKTASSESKLIFGVAEGFCRAFGVGIVFFKFVHNCKTDFGSKLEGSRMSIYKQMISQNLVQRYFNKINTSSESKGGVSESLSVYKMLVIVYHSLK